MSKRNLKLFLFVAVLSFMALPAFAGYECKKCSTYSADNGMIMNCIPPDSGVWGNTECKITCERVGQSGIFCTCQDEMGWGCLYEVVQG